MKFLVYSIGGDGAGIAYQLQKEGNRVFFCVDDKNKQSILDGVVEHVEEKDALKNKPDVILTDMTGKGELADEWRKSGENVVSGGHVNDVLEHDRSKAFQVASKMGISIPPFTSFEGPDTSKAIEFVRKTGKRYVMKPDDDLGTALTYVSKDPDDMIQELEYAGKKGIIKGSFLLQEFVEGVEISTEAWFQNGEPIPTLCNSTLEVKKLMAGDKGPATGCEFSVVWPYESDNAKIVRETVKKLYPFLRAVKYSGPLDINCIVTKEGKVYFLEMTPRIGYSAIYGFAELMKRDLGEFLYAVAKGRAPAMMEGVGCALTLSIPPYPLDSGEPEDNKIFKRTQGKRILNVPAEHFWPCDLMNEDNGWVTAGCHGLVGYVTSRGSTVEEAARTVYKRAESIDIPDGQMRVDGFDRPSKDIPKLASLGYEVPNLGVEEQEKEIAEVA
jgi:phosphoribosylamine-glycine ligase